MSQRGSVGIYLMFSIVVSVAAGFGTYRYMRDHKSTQAEASPPKQAPAEITPPAVARPVEAVPVPVAPTPDPLEPAVTARSVADERAVDPAINDDYETPSPALGVAGIDGALERTSVDRRFRARTSQLQRCFEQSGAEAGVVRVTMQVEPTGKIASVTLSDGWNDAFSACVITLVSTMSYSAPHDGKHATVVQPIRFH